MDAAGTGDNDRTSERVSGRESHMTRVVLINQEKVPHYRVPVYNYLSEYLAARKFALTVVSEGVQAGTTHEVRFDHRVVRLTLLPLVRDLIAVDPDIVIYWVRLRHLYLFPLLVLLKILRKRIVYWGHGSDLGKQMGGAMRRAANNIEYLVSDALIIYAEHLKAHVPARFHRKSFVANNTLYFADAAAPANDRRSPLRKYGITTSRNIICTGRLQRRKRLEHLFAALELIKRPDVGLILVGPDSDGVLNGVNGNRVYKLGPIYGDEVLRLLRAADVFCLPGAVGLSIVDAFHCGLPLVTEEGDESPEIMYLKDGINGFVVPRGDIRQLASRLESLLSDDELRERFSRAARHEITTNGHIDRMCQGFSSALEFVRDGR
jgi:glycosyltransferase involved in cell wall biosynthesis